MPPFVIGLRRTLERGRAHPILGPILLIVLVFVLAMLYLHAMEDGQGAATELGGICLGVITVVWLVITQLVRRRTLTVAPVIQCGERGPPSPNVTDDQQAVVAFASASFPLRR